jgi:dihydroorotate dehydrogenase (fumarate)
LNPFALLKPDTCIAFKAESSRWTSESFIPLLDVLSLLEMDLQTEVEAAQTPSKYLISINPPLLNSSNPWATTYDDLKRLYDCPYTGAVTIRTSLWTAFTQHPNTHQYTFFSPSLGHATAPIDTSLAEGRSSVLPNEASSLNTLGYSPISFPDYTKILINLSQAGDLPIRPAKPFIISVTGSAFEVAACATHLMEIQNNPEKCRWKPDGDYADLEIMMEINLSCPNIPDKPPPAYDGPALSEYIIIMAEAMQLFSHTQKVPLRIGLKTPPYTHHAQFQTLIHVLEESTKMPSGCPISFITATNTLGSCLVLDEKNSPALGSVNGSGIGGMAGDALHPLALGNVKIIREMLDKSEYEHLHRIAIVGIGGVKDAAGFRRMKSVGASAVGVGTALGREGISIFEKITKGL